MIPAVRRLSPLGALVHDWKFTIQQLMGLDAGLNEGGSGQSADMFQFYRTSREFRSMFGTGRAIGASDFLRFAKLSTTDRRYFARRWRRSLRGHLGRRVDRETAGPLGDLRKLSFRMGARLSVTMKSGRKLTAERIIPTGMAGDPDRRGMVHEKLLAEGEPVLGSRQCELLWIAIMDLEAATKVSLARLACFGGQRVDE
jgi:hypothetical protein